MKVVIDKDGFVESYALLGDIVDSLAVDDPEDIDAFEKNFSAYRYVDGKLTFDNSKQASIADQAELADLRYRREVECFPVINRGALWYERLTDIQKEELSAWYQAWLDVTETRIVPTTPEWVG